MLIPVAHRIRGQRSVRLRGFPASPSAPPSLNSSDPIASTSTLGRQARAAGEWCGRSPQVVAHLAILFLLLATLGTHAAPANYTQMMQAKKAGKPNIIFILADDLGYGDLGCYGQKRIRTPRLDRLAGEGTRFTHHYAGSTVCAPSRATLLTGLHTGHARVRGNALVPLQPNDTTVAQLLQTAGYRTCAIGKWGLGRERTSGHPNRQGFDEWLGYLDQTHAHDYYPPELWRNEQILTLPENANGQQGHYSHDLFTDAALRFIRNHQKFPFFLYLAYTIPHANTALGRLTGNGMQVPTPHAYSTEPWPEPERNKAAMISRLDADIGRLLDLLDELHLAHETIIFFSSDNGPHQAGGVDPAFFESSGPLRGIKRDLYEGGIRVPMIVRWKGRVPAGRVSNQIWAFWDFLPTAAELALSKPPPNLDGISFAPTLLGQTQTHTHEFLYWEFHENGFHQAVRHHDWKAVRHGLDQPIELYHLPTDPSEQHNVATHQPAVTHRIQQFLATARTDSPHWPTPSPGSALKN
jgi:arylsulfatase A-like enzyme